MQWANRALQTFWMLPVAYGSQTKSKYSSKAQGLTFGDTTFINSFKKRNFPTSLWNLLPQFFMQASSTCIQVTETGAEMNTKTLQWQHSHILCPGELKDPRQRDTDSCSAIQARISRLLGWHLQTGWSSTLSHVHLGQLPHQEVS